MDKFGQVILKALFLGLAVIACSSSAIMPSVSIRPVESSVFLRLSAQGLAFDMGAIIVNAGPGAISLAECSPHLQRKLDARWVTVWSPVCITSGSRQQILAGDSAFVRVRGSAFTNVASQPQLDPQFTSGTYRLLWSIFYANNSTGPAKTLPSDQSLSGEFRITIER